jgi:hypothetical protein
LDLTLRPFHASSSAPAWIGLAIALGYLLLHVVFDALFQAVGGFPASTLPIWRSDIWWTDVVNAALVGYLPAAQAIARRGVARDLTELRPRLYIDADELDALRDAATGPGGPLARVLSLSGIAIGAWIAFADPLVSLGATASLTDPIFIWALARTVLFVWLVTRFTVYDFRTTLTYVGLGRHTIEVDLLDTRAPTAFARRGQRSALTWVLFSSIFSLFWLGEAARGNLPLLAMVLSLATFAFVGPLLALHRNIQAAKRAELDRLREEIRAARAAADEVESPRLANVIASYQLVESASEWPIDAANLVRFIGYLLLGLGSWLGGALVERLVDRVLRS